MKNKSYFILVFLNLAGFLGMVVVNILANALPINGITTGDVSNLYPNLFVPAGITFSIWGLIYLLLLLFIIFNFVSVYGKGKKVCGFLPKISLLFFLSSLLNMAWIFAWHYDQLPVSIGIMVLLLVCLILIYRRLQIGLRKTSAQEKYFVHLPFSIYLGWITIATIANAAAVLVDFGWGGWGLSPTFWTIIMMMAGAFLAIVLVMMRKDIYYGLVIIWALAGIFIKRFNSEPQLNSILLSSLIFIGLVLLAQVIQIGRKKFY